ncbi:winged helix-turn-helix transcriptional regulator [Allorhizocola rhizosphaerae]|uniref:winged helix-turn-helix transcriptional regulator n=1 Tax=Allorhizocola rhizosphaerae TaxID=1872709 RepID=UPI000E3CFEC2|nr:helix-turn-helix transcriptional regulator [Allorhizocola rhizosphaerae]
MIDIDTLVRIAGYFRFRWDPPILAELAQRPSRFRQLATRLQRHVGEHVDDNALSRSLQRLTRSGLVTADDNRVGRRDFKVYRLTAKGHAHVHTYGALAAVFVEKPDPHPGQDELGDPQRTDDAA